MTEKTIFDHLTEQTKREEAKATRQAADIETFEQLFAWLYNYSSEVDVREFNLVLVDYAEYILEDPQPFSDKGYDTVARGRCSFLGLALRETAKTTKTRPYSAVLMELAGSIHASTDFLDDPPEDYELACGMAFALANLKDSGLFRFKRKSGSTYLLGTKKLKRGHGITVRVAIDPICWYDIK